MSAVRALPSALRTRAAARPRLEAVDKRDAALMSIGTLASGVLAYAFNVLAARSLGPELFGAVGALWAGMFLVSVLLYRPVEQTLSRAVADQLARGADARPAVRTTAKLTLAVTVVAVAACIAAWQPLTDGLFGGEAVLTAALVAGIVGYGASYFARGLAGGVKWFEGYGIVLLADGAIRVIVALPLVFVASPAVAGAAIAAAAIGGAVAPLLSRRRSRLRRLVGEQPAAAYPMRETVRFALPAGVIAGSEQVLISGGPLLILIAGGPGAAAAAGVLFAATLLVRAPVFLFQGVAASLLPNLTTFRAQGDEARLHRATAQTAFTLAGLAALMAGAALVAGPAAMELLYGDDFVATRTDLALLALGIGGFLAACTFCQALLARDQGGAAALRWTFAAASFVALWLTLSGTSFHRVAVAFAIASGLVGVLLMIAVWKERA